MIFLTYAMLMVNLPISAQSSDSGWVLRGDARLAPHLGRQAVQLRTGLAYRRDILFGDGTIEFDLAPLTDRRSFLGLTFRMTSEEDYEDVYFRPAASGAWDAIQYEGVWQFAGSWQLYSGPGATAPAMFWPDRWTHVKVVVRGQRAEVYYNGSDSAVLVVPELKRGISRGHVGFWAFYPNAGADTSFTASFSNLVIRPGVFLSGRAVDPALPGRSPGTIEAWLVSPPKPATDSAFPARLGPALTQSVSDWRRITAEPSGLVNVTRAFPKPANAKRGEVFARVRVRANREQLARFDFGYSDDVAVYLNGRILYSGINGFSTRYPFYLGIVTPDFESLYLPLRAGDNEIVLVSRDDLQFGWGFAARLVSAPGVTISP